MALRLRPTACALCGARLTRGAIYRTFYIPGRPRVGWCGANLFEGCAHDLQPPTDAAELRTWLVHVDNLGPGRVAATWRFWGDPPKGSVRCTGITKAGTRCWNLARWGSLCHQHRR